MTDMNKVNAELEAARKAQDAARKAAKIYVYYTDLKSEAEDVARDAAEAANAALEFEASLDVKEAAAFAEYYTFVIEESLTASDAAFKEAKTALEEVKAAYDAAEAEFNAAYDAAYYVAREAAA